MQLNCPHCHKANRVPAQRLGDSPRCGACAQDLLDGVVELDSATLQDAIANSNIALIVDFWAPWCGPCRMFAPTFEAAAKKHGGKLMFIKVNTENEEQAAASHQIRSIPTLAVFHGGLEIGRVAGALPAAQLEQLIGQVKTQVQTQT